MQQSVHDEIIFFIGGTNGNDAGAVRRAVDSLVATISEQRAANDLTTGRAAELRELALAVQRGAHMVPSFHADLLSGVATSWWEFMLAVPQLDVVYVPIGQGSGACAAIAAKLALGRSLRIVGVVSASSSCTRRREAV